MNSDQIDSAMTDSASCPVPDVFVPSARAGSARWRLRGSTPSALAASIEDCEPLLCCRAELPGRRRLTPDIVGREAHISAKASAPETSPHIDSARSNGHGRHPRSRVYSQFPPTAAMMTEDVERRERPQRGGWASDRRYGIELGHEPALDGSGGESEVDRRVVNRRWLGASVLTGV